MSALAPLHDHVISVMHALQHGRVAVHRTQDVDRAGWPNLVPAACGRRSEEQAQGLARRPIPDIAQVYDLPGVCSSASTGVRK